MENLNNIISSCLNKERNAQKALYDYTYQSLAGVITLYVKDVSQRDWIFNIGMLKIFSTLNKYSQGTNYLGWARTILVRTAIDQYRSSNKDKVTLVPLDTIKESTVGPIDSALNKINTDDIVHLLQGLKDDQKMVFTLFEIEGYKHREIAAKIGINVNTSKWLLSKARLWLIENIKKSPKLISKNGK